MSKLPSYSYAEKFREESIAGNYELQYANGGYDHYIWQKEKEWLGLWINNRSDDIANGRVMDYAAGTGRLTGFLNSLGIDDLVGLDQSTAMLNIAKEKYPDLDFFQVSNPSDSPQTGYTLITSFRLFVNIPRDIRKSVLESMRLILEQDGRVIISVQANADAPSRVIRRLFKAKKHTNDEFNGELSVDQVHDMLKETGFDVDQYVAVSWVPTKLWALSERLSILIDGICSKLPFMRKYAVHLIYVAKPSDV